MGDIFDIFSGGFPNLKKTVGRFAVYTLLFIWTIKKQYESTDEIVTTFFYWFFLVSLVLAVVSFIGFVFFAIGYRDYLKSDSDLLMLDWPKRVKLFNKVGLDRTVAITVFIFSFVTFLVRPFSMQTMLTADEPLARGFLIEIGGLALLILFWVSGWEDTYKLIDRGVYAIDTNNLLIHRKEDISWHDSVFCSCKTLVLIVAFAMLSLILASIKDSFQLPFYNFIVEWFKR